MIQKLPLAEPLIDECTECDGTGWQVDENNTAHRCACFDRTIVDRRIKSAEIPERHNGATLANFDGTLHVSAAAAAELAAALVEDYPKTAGLLLAGSPGTGKTHLAAAALRELIEKHDVFGLFVSWNQLLERIQATYDTDASTSAAMLPLQQADVLVLDELAARRVTPWAHDVLTWLIGRRYDDKKPTIITTNYVGGELTERIGRRLHSRLAEMCTAVELTGYDYRVRQGSA